MKRAVSAGNFRLVERLRVRWVESDAHGIVFNGHYLTCFDIAIAEYWRAIGSAHDRYR